MIGHQDEWFEELQILIFTVEAAYDKVHGGFFRNESFKSQLLFKYKHILRSLRQVYDENHEELLADTFQ